MIYDMIEKSNTAESEKNKPNIESASRKSQSRLPKKDEEEPKGKRKRESRCNSDDSHKQSKLSRKQQNDYEAEISDKESKGNTDHTEPDASTSEENKIKSGKKSLMVSIEKIPTKSKKAESNTKQDATKEFSKKPLPKKYPLRSNKEVEAAEILLAKYKTINKKDNNEDGEPSNVTSTSNSFSDNLDNTDLDANYSPEESNNSSTTSVPETPKLPIITRPTTRSMKPSESNSGKRETTSASNKSSKKRKTMDENAENNSSQKANKKAKDSGKKSEEKADTGDQIPEPNNEEVEDHSKIGDEKLQVNTERKSQKKKKEAKKGKTNKDTDTKEKDGEDDHEEITDTKKRGRSKKKKSSIKKEAINDDEDPSKSQNNDIPDTSEESQKGGATKKKKTASKRDEIKGAEEEDDDFYKCNICDKVFPSNEKYKEHKKKCTKVPKKYVCSKCSKGFTARSYLVQHYDYQHTNKPKQFCCESCNTDFELEKSFKEHN